GRMIADGTPMEVLNRYQRVIMAREEAYADTSGAAAVAEEDGGGGQERAGEVAFDEAAATAAGARRQPLQYSYRHGNKRAEVIGAELFDAATGRASELIETGDAVAVRLRVLFHEDVAEPVCGFMIRNRHGINVYGTNTEQRGQPLGAVARGEIIEAVFTFDCWLGQEHYFVSVAAHTPDGEAFDWLDGAIFFRVSCAVEMEGIANLNARVTTRRVGVDVRGATRDENVSGGAGEETRAVKA
ncbi:MAG TPA: Wzt carbohydrate-binding domain-containing protein, partial [Pyrinomonadaceae bacterium]